jgi:hydroxypyruvate isomerase
MPRLCANLGFRFGEMPFIERFEAAARAGFTGVEDGAPYEYPMVELHIWLRLPASEWC